MLIMSKTDLTTHPLKRIPCCRRIVMWGALGWAFVGGAGAQSPWIDEDFRADDYRTHYLAAYGVNMAVEPQLTAEDRQLYGELLPLVADDPSAAREQVSAYLRDHPEANPAFDFLLGSLDYQAGRWDQAASHLEAALEKHPSFRRAHRTLALIRLQQENLAAGGAHLLKVVTLGGGDAQSYGLLGYVYLRQGKYRSALVAYQNARLFAPDSLDFRRGEAQCLAMTGQVGQARALYDELLAEHPGDAELWLLRANASLATEDRRAATVDLEMARGLGAGAFANLNLLANLYFETELPELGVERATQALAVATVADFGATLPALEFLVQRDRMALAERYGRALAEAFAGRLDGANRHRLSAAEAMVDFSMGRDERGVERLQALLEEEPTNGRALLLLGRHYLADGDWAEAEFYFTRAEAMVDFRAEALVELGRLEVAQGEWRKALAFLREAQQIRPRANVQAYVEQVVATIHDTAP